MNQTTDPEHETWRAPWAPPARPGQPQDAAGAEQPADTGSRPGVTGAPGTTGTTGTTGPVGEQDTQRFGRAEHATQGYPAPQPTQSYPAQAPAQPPAQPARPVDRPAPPTAWGADRPASGWGTGSQAPPPASSSPAATDAPDAPTAFSGPGAWPAQGGYGQSAPAYVSPAPGYEAHLGGGLPPNGPAARKARRDVSGPGWIGTIAIGAGAAVLASALTGGVLYASDRNDPSPTGSAFNQSQSAQPKVDAPVKSSTAANPDWEAVADAVEPSVVSVQLSQGEGSGVILDTEGRILTNNHVVAAGGDIHVVLNDGRAYAAEVVGTDATTDLAVIKLTKPPAGLKAIVLGDSSAVEVGDPVMAVGNPLGLAGTVTTGIVSAVNRPVTTQAQEEQQQSDPFGFNQPQQSSGEQVVTNAIQTDAAVNPGNSGGALVDAQGRLIGINSSIASLSGGSGGAGSIGLGFAIPVNLAQSVAQELIKTGKAEHAWMGVSLQSKTVTVDDAQRASATIGAPPTSDSPAAKAGLKQGDSVIAVDGSAINGSDSLVAYVRSHRPGDTITLTVVRDGKTQDIKVTLASKPGDAS